MIEFQLAIILPMYNLRLFICAIYWGKFRVYGLFRDWREFEDFQIYLAMLISFLDSCTGFSCTCYNISGDTSCWGGTSWNGHTGHCTVTPNKCIWKIDTSKSFSTTTLKHIYILWVSRFMVHKLWFISLPLEWWFWILRSHILLWKVV